MLAAKTFVSAGNVALVHGLLPPQTLSLTVLTDLMVEYMQIHYLRLRADMDPRKQVTLLNAHFLQWLRQRAMPLKPSAPLPPSRAPAAVVKSPALEDEPDYGEMETPVSDEEWCTPLDDEETAVQQTEVPLQETLEPVGVVDTLSLPKRMPIMEGEQCATSNLRVEQAVVEYRVTRQPCMLSLECIETVGQEQKRHVLLQQVDGEVDHSALAEKLSAHSINARYVLKDGWICQEALPGKRVAFDLRVVGECPEAVQVEKEDNRVRVIVKDVGWPVLVLGTASWTLDAESASVCSDLLEVHAGDRFQIQCLNWPHWTLHAALFGKVVEVPSNALPVLSL